MPYGFSACKHQSWRGDIFVGETEMLDSLSLQLVNPGTPWQNIGMDNEPEKPALSEAERREKRLKAALRNNLQRRKQKARALRDEGTVADEGSVTAADDSNS